MFTRPEVYVSAPRTIDAHAHIGDFPGFVPGGPHTAEQLVAEWDAQGIESGMISVLDTANPSGANDITRAACEAHPGRIHGFIYINPHDVEAAVAELDRCAPLDCFRGVKFHPMNDVFFPFRERYFPVYERMQELRLPSLWHTGTYPYSSPLAVASVARQFPDVPWILAHFALADLTWECFPAADLAPNARFDMSANPIVPVLDEWIDRFGAERMLWGSDWPFYSVPYERAKVNHLACSAAAKERILAGNAAELFDL